MYKNKTAIFFALLAAALYAVNVPLSRVLMLKTDFAPGLLAGLLYLGAGVGMGMLMGIKKAFGKSSESPNLGKKDTPYVIAMVVLDIAAPMFLMYGVRRCAAATVSLLNNFEIVATSLIAMLVFGEKISRRLWASISLVTLAGILLGLDIGEKISFDDGAILVLLACLCWGVENNCTRRISDKNAEQIVLIKGIFSGIGAIVLALLNAEHFPELIYVIFAMILGFVSYGLSIRFYIMAQSTLGAAKTSAFYSIAPFLGVGFSFVLLGTIPEPLFYAGLAIMLMATLFMIKDTLNGKTEQ